MFKLPLIKCYSEGLFSIKIIFLSLADAGVLERLMYLFPVNYGRSEPRRFYLEFVSIILKVQKATSGRAGFPELDVKPHRAARTAKGFKHT